MEFSPLNLLKFKELRSKLLFTLGMLLLYRVGFFIPLPGVNVEKLAERLRSGSDGGGFGKLLGMMNVLTGARLEEMVLFSLGVMPYISASIIFSLLAKIYPALERLAKEGQAGQRKINQYTRLATVPICLLQSMLVVFGGSLREHVLPSVADYWLLYMFVVMAALTAGTIFVMWIGEQITEHGIGNGTSLIIMAGIIARLPQSIQKLIEQPALPAAQVGQELAMFFGAWILAVAVIVYITKGTRRIPIQQAKQTRGRQVYGGQRHYLPLKVNQSGVMPIIFASTLLLLPYFLGQALSSLTGGRVSFLADAFADHRGFVYLASYTVLIFFFSFFWTSMMFQPNEMANNLKEYGSFIPGIRPGKRTAEFLESTMVRITLAGAAFLAFVAILPNIVISGIGITDSQFAYFLGGTSILIVVGVALDMVEKIKGMLVMRSYDGFLKGGESSGWGRRGK
jgi:preprotein translocase subunit SecY